jgi:LysR family transcriptional regulator, carnitine catabolism transcriptional activator
MRISLTLPQMTAFLRLTDARSFSKAAAVLGVSQPSLSRMIRSAEAALRGPLFYRDTRNLELTPLGAELRPIARRIVVEFDSAFGELAQFIEGQRGRLVVAALPSIAATLLPNAIAHFQRTNPNVDIIIRDSLAAPVNEAVAQGIADIGLTVQPLPSAKLAYTELVTDDFLLICRADSPLPKRKPSTWSSFAQHPFIAMSPASSVRSMTDAALLQARVSVKQLYECAHLATTSGLVAAGLGLTALPRLTLPLLNMEALGTRRLIEPVMTRSLGVITRIGRPITPACRAFLDALQHQASSVAKRVARSTG